jgi:hypothetical protein
MADLFHGRAHEFDRGSRTGHWFQLKAYQIGTVWLVLGQDLKAFKEALRRGEKLVDKNFREMRELKNKTRTVLDPHLNFKFVYQESPLQSRNCTTSLPRED